MFTPQPIGFVRSPYRETSAIPKGLATKHNAEGILEILPEFEPGLDRAEGFDLFGRVPADNREHGVFATRSPRRPNPIGLTVVELLQRDGNNLMVRGLDMLDGTPLLDIKPFMTSIPQHALRRGWLADAEDAASRG
jgi:tRNA (Thr-GGU) A37 N-methylase